VGNCISEERNLGEVSKVSLSKIASQLMDAGFGCDILAYVERDKVNLGSISSTFYVYSFYARRSRKRKKILTT